MSAEPRWEPSVRPASRSGTGLRAAAPATGSEPAPFDVRVATSIAIASLAAGAIHAAAAIEDAGEGTATLLFFVGVALAQSAWGLVALGRASRTWLALGAIGNLAVAAVWVWSRTAGLPVGGAPGVALPPSFPDMIATVFEVGIALGATALARRGTRVDRALRRAPGFAAGALVVIGGIATVAVLAQLGVITALGAGS
ncbi:MAG TPA: hypothetical protein VNN79_25275 [Actinomycetota bacterium]|nr:hypothetical protein [Actinomycetota bacterium]